MDSHVQIFNLFACSKFGHFSGQFEYFVIQILVTALSGCHTQTTLYPFQPNKTTIFPSQLLPHFHNKPLLYSHPKNPKKPRKKKKNYPHTYTNNSENMEIPAQSLSHAKLSKPPSFPTSFNSRASLFASNSVLNITKKRHYSNSASRD